MSKHSPRYTLTACYIGYVVQAITNNLLPLLFVTLQKDFGFSITQIGLLVTINFMIQIGIDFFAIRVVDRIGFRVISILAHIFSTIGLISMGILPFIMANAYVGIVLSVVLMATGSGMLEVIVSPIVESIPGDAKASAMSLLHSFYCWGHIAVVLLSTLYFLAAGTENWRWLPMLWAVLPLFNCFLCSQMPLYPLVEEGKKTSVFSLFRKPEFYIFILLMLCGGASEQAVVQWSSFFAENGLGISKTVGDILGPCLFALCMALTRTYFGVKGERISLRKALTLSAFSCFVMYALMIFLPFPILSLICCALSGMTVGLMWPGIFSLASARFRNAGVALFAMLALAGDMGCSLGPTMVGFVADLSEGGKIPLLSSLFSSIGGTASGLKPGIFVAMVFPFAMIVFLGILTRIGRKNKQEGRTMEEKESLQ